MPIEIGAPSGGYLPEVFPDLSPLIHGAELIGGQQAALQRRQLDDYNRDAIWQQRLQAADMRQQQRLQAASDLTDQRFQNQQQILAQQGQQNAELWDYKYTTKQQRDIAQIEQNKNVVQQRFDQATMMAQNAQDPREAYIWNQRAQQYQDSLNALDAKKMGIKPIPTPKAPPKDPQVEGQNFAYIDPQKGWTIGPPPPGFAGRSYLWNARAGKWDEAKQDTAAIEQMREDARIATELRATEEKHAQQVIQTNEKHQMELWQAKNSGHAKVYQAEISGWTKIRDAYIKQAISENELAPNDKKRSFAQIQDEANKAAGPMPQLKVEPAPWEQQQPPSAQVPPAVQQAAAAMQQGIGTGSGPTPQFDAAAVQAGIDQIGREQAAAPQKVGDKVNTRFGSGTIVLVGSPLGSGYVYAVQLDNGRMMNIDTADFLPGNAPTPDAAPQPIPNANPEPPQPMANAPAAPPAMTLTQTMPAVPINGMGIYEPKTQKQYDDIPKGAKYMRDGKVWVKK